MPDPHYLGIEDRATLPLLRSGEFADLLLRQETMSSVL